MRMEVISDSRHQFNFAGVHFRFNPGDFFAQDFLKKEETENAGNHMHSSISVHIHRSLSRPRYLIRLLSKYLNKYYPKHHPTTVFIASPADIAVHLSNSSAEMSREKSYEDLKVFTTLDTDRFLKGYAESCEVIREFYGDILSTLEKEIMSFSRIFFRTRPSNWSFNVQGSRMARYRALEIG